MADEAEISLVADSIVEIGGTIIDASLVSFEDVERTWIEVKGLVDIGEFGDEANVSSIELIDGARVRKKKGTFDAGDMELVVARDPLDPGQQALRAAVKTKSAYAIRITANDAPEGGTPTVHYLKAYVATGKNRQGSANDFVQTAFLLAVDAEPLTVEAEEAA